MISDFVKGRKQFDLPPAIQKGIRLHRLIDRYTDTHEATAIVKDIFRPAAGRYNAVFADVAYDYFLANDEQEFPAGELFEFSQRTYETLDRYSFIFPEKFARIYPYMKTQNWLYGYRTEEGIRQSFSGIARRSAYLPGSEDVFHLFIEQKQPLQHCYRLLWKDIKTFAESECRLL